MDLARHIVRCVGDTGQICVRGSYWRWDGIASDIASHITNGEAGRMGAMLRYNRPTAYIIPISNTERLA